MHPTAAFESPPAQTPAVPPEDLVLAAAQLERAWLAKVEFHENPLFDLERDSVEYVVSQETDLEFIDQDDRKTAVLRLATSIDWRHLSDQSVEVPFELALTAAGLFTLNKQDLDEDFMRSWLEYNGVYLLWPYLRTYIAVVTGSSRLPPLTIYTMRVPAPPTVDTAEVDESASAST